MGRNSGSTSRKSTSGIRSPSRKRKRRRSIRRFEASAFLPVDDESLPLHVLAAEPTVREREVGQFLMATEERLAAYGGVFSVFHQAIWREVETMAQRSRRTLPIDISPVVETLGLEEVIRQLGEENVIRQIGEGRFIRRIGEEKVLRELGLKRVIEQLDVQTIWDNLPAAKRRQLKRLLAEE